MTEYFAYYDINFEIGYIYMYVYYVTHMYKNDSRNSLLRKNPYFYMYFSSITLKKNFSPILFLLLHMILSVVFHIVKNCDKILLKFNNKSLNKFSV